MKNSNIIILIILILIAAGFFFVNNRKDEEVPMATDVMLEDVVDETMDDAEKMEAEDENDVMMEEEKDEMMDDEEATMDDDEATMEDKDVVTYTMADVELHASPEDCWLVLDGKVYDVSNFGEKHGGGEAVYEGCGLDATTLFETRPMGSGTPHSEKARGFLPNFYIGDLAQ